MMRTLFALLLVGSAYSSTASAAELRPGLEMIGVNKPLNSVRMERQTEIATGLKEASVGFRYCTQLLSTETHFSELSLLAYFKVGRDGKLKNVSFDRLDSEDNSLAFQRAEHCYERVLKLLTFKTSSESNVFRYLIRARPAQ